VFHPGRHTPSRSQPTSLALARLQRQRVRLDSAVDTVAPGRPPAGELAVRWERCHGMLVMWLSGALDRATVTLLDYELDRRAIGQIDLVVDVTGLILIDSAGLDALVGIHWRASTRGEQLSFRHGPHVAQRPFELTRAVRRRSRWGRPAGVTDEDFYVALAMACVDVDHPPSDDRPEAA
jgi:anti-anti-sigma regulatory factor